jgi:hypothetical protein
VYFVTDRQRGISWGVKDDQRKRSERERERSNLHIQVTLDNSKFKGP